MPALDQKGKEIKVGDRIAFAINKYSQGWGGRTQGAKVVVGTVTRVSEEKGKMGQGSRQPLDYYLAVKKDSGGGCRVYNALLTLVLPDDY